MLDSPKRLKKRPVGDQAVAWLCAPDGNLALDVRERAPGPESGRLNFFAPDFALNSRTPWLVGDTHVGAFTPSPLELPEIIDRIEPSATVFDQMHEEILNRIAAEEFAKVVPIVREELVFAADLQPAMFPRTWQNHPDQYAYGFYLERRGLGGITPELLFDVQDERLTTMALAGTGPFNGPSLLEDPKERREHDFVIEHITRELKIWGSPDVGTTIEKRYGLIKHLFTPISLNLKSLPSFMDLVVRLHPTAALGGWPRRPAIEWLERQPFHVTRGSFGAPFGFCEGSRMRCVVAIRGLQWHGPKASIFAGCGVVKGSESSKEWRELALKRSAIYRHLGMIERLGAKP